MGSRFVTCGIIISSLLACKSPSSSDLEGHWETDRGEKDIAPFANKFAPVPEYEPSQFLILSEKILDKADTLDILHKVSRSRVQQVLFAFPDADQEAAKRLNLVQSEMRRTGLDKKFAMFTIPIKKRGDHSVWVRDYGPISLRQKGGKDLLIADFNYHADREVDDHFNRTFASLGKIKRMALPLYFEGGNFLAVDFKGKKFCMTTSLVAEDNSEKHLKNDQEFNQLAIMAMFKRYLGCDVNLVFPRMPHEGTGHIDMWAKGFRGGKIMVGEMLDATVRKTSYRPWAEDIKKFLDDRAQDLKNHGFEVLRVPMPAPVTSVDPDVPLMRSYVNSLTLNHMVFLPRYTTPGEGVLRALGQSYPDQDLTRRYELAAVDAYMKAGYAANDIVWIGADDLIADGGAIHCATMQVPPLNPVSLAPGENPPIEVY